MSRILIFDGAKRAWQTELATRGAPTNPDLFRNALSIHDPGLEFVEVNVADGDRLPAGGALADIDGVVVTGSPLNIYDGGEAVTRQIDALREVFAAGVPVWGSCWGLQLATTVLGGSVRLNPNGRELGIARNITPTERGRGHTLFAGKAAAFDALCSHIDEVDGVPDGGRVLAANGVSAVQALEVERDGVSFLGVQYHPEHTFGTIAAIVDGRRDRLVEEGLAHDAASLNGIVADFRALDAEPNRTDLAWRYGFDRYVADTRLRSAEIGNWLAAKVAPRRAVRAAAA